MFDFSAEVLTEFSSLSVPRGSFAGLRSGLGLR